MKDFIETAARHFADWWTALPVAAAACFLLAVFLFILVVCMTVDAWRQGAEARAIRRAKRERFVSHQRLAARREDVSPEVSRAFLRALTTHARQMHVDRDRK
jgi:hypothetical protein